MTGAVLLVMGGLVPVHAPIPLAIGAVLDQGHTLLLQEGEMTTLLPHAERTHLLLQYGEMTTLLPHRERSRITQNLPGVSQKSMKKTCGDRILLPLEMVANEMLIILMRRDHHHLTVMDLLHAGGHPGNPQDHLQDHAPGLRMRLLPAATDR